MNDRLIDKTLNLSSGENVWSSFSMIQLTIATIDPTVQIQKTYKNVGMRHEIDY